jgi:hypothetical protein
MLFQGDFILVQVALAAAFMYSLWLLFPVVPKVVKILQRATTRHPIWVIIFMVVVGIALSAYSIMWYLIYEYGITGLFESALQKGIVIITLVGFASRWAFMIIRVSRAIVGTRIPLKIAFLVFLLGSVLWFWIVFLHVSS